MYACLYQLPPASPGALVALAALAHDFSPRYERHGERLVVIDVSGLERLLGPARAIGDELRRAATAAVDKDLRVNIAIAGTQAAACALALARPGLTIVEPGGEAAALAPVSVGILEHPQHQSQPQHPQVSSSIAAVKRWGIHTLGELAALPAADLVARLGPAALDLQAMARGEDRRPLVPTLDEERFESTLELEWPIEGLEPLSFVLTRLLEPLSTRLERRDRGAAVLHVLLRLVTREVAVRRLELPSPLREVRALRTLALLDLEAHPPAAAIDRVTIVIDPTPGRVLQHTLFTRAHPTPERLSTLLARLGALMGQDRIGAPATIDTDRPGAFAMMPFKTEHTSFKSQGSSLKSQSLNPSPQPSALSPAPIHSALRRCRQPVPARVAVAGGRPVRVTSDRRGYPGGAVVQCAGPWKTSGAWWMHPASPRDRTHATHATHVTLPTRPAFALRASARQAHATHATHATSWDREEWDVALSDGAMYRIFRDCETNDWFVDAIVD